MELRRFLELNEAMALRELLDQILRVEAAWDDPSQRQSQLEKLFELLDGAALHRGPTVRSLSALRQRIPENPTFHQFMSLVVPIERQHSRAIADGDFPVATEDRQEPKEAQLMPLVLVGASMDTRYNSTLNGESRGGVGSGPGCGSTGRRSAARWRCSRS